MIGTFELKLTASQPQKPLPPVFSFQGSPQSLRLIDVPKSIGNWQITKVKVSALYPNNRTVTKEATRTGSVWVATFDGCETAGKVTQGLTILADGLDEGNEPVENYKLGKADIYVLEDENDIRRMVAGSTLVYRDDIPATPSKGDVLVVGEELKIYNGEEWVTISGGSSGDTYTKEEIDEMVSSIDSSISELGASVSAIDSSVSTLGSSLSILSASVSSFGEDLAVVNASVSSLASQVTRLSSSMTSLASTKRDKTDRVWKYTRETDTEMYGVQKFQVANDTISETYELQDFNPTTKVWSMFEGQATPTPPPTVKAYSYALFAVIDENNPHTFEDDDEIERQGWPFYRTSDTINSWLISAGEYEYSVRATPRADTSLALDDTVAEKRDYEDLSWKYPMDKDPVRFGVQSFEITYSGNLYNLNSFTSSGVSRVWAQGAAPYGDRFEITATSAHDFTLRDKVTAKTTGFTRLNDSNNSWELQNGQDIYIVLASRRAQGSLALYEPDTSNPDEVRIDFGSSSAGLMLGTNLSASTQAFVQIGDVMLTGNNYVSSRAATRGEMKKRGDEPHLKVNGEAVAFVNEIEAATSQLTSEIETVTASVSALGSSIETMGSSVQALASSIDGKRDYEDLSYANHSQEAMTRAPTYGIGKMIATPSDGTDPLVMDTFFIHENEGGTSLGSCWYKASYLYCGTTDGTNFTLVDIGFQTLTTFTKTQLLAGEVTFTHGNKEWTLTAELGDGMIDWWNININSMDWKTTIYSYDSTTRTAKWRPT